MKRKVLITASTFGHIANFHVPYLRAFRDLGWEVHVFCGGEVKALPYVDRIEVLPLKKEMLSLDNFRAAAWLRRILREEDYGLIITHTSLAAFFTRLALLGRKERPRTVNVVHGYLFDDDTGYIRSGLLKLAERSTAGVTDAVLTMNAYDYQWAIKNRVSRQIKRIPGMGFDPRRLYGGSDRKKYGFCESDFLLIYAAEFSRRKNQSFLIGAMSGLPKRVKLVLLGDGALLEECKALAEKLGVSDRVLFPGYERDVGQWLRIADAAVSASRFEGLPFHLMEAMACGLPVVASRVKGNEDIVQHGETGFLYEYNNREEYSQAVLKLVSFPQIGRDMSCEAVKRAEEYSIDRVFPQIMEAYLMSVE